ncbi:MAG: TrkH family potassium uptake protein [Cyclonatronaceae bacterium]
MNEFTTEYYSQGSLVNLKLISGIVGFLLLFLGLFMLLPVVVGLIYSETDAVYAFLAASAICCGSGAVLYFAFKPGKELRTREAFLVVSLSWLTFSLFSAIPFMLEGSLVSFSDAFFESMSGLTTTGATIFGGTTYSGTSNPSLDTLSKTILFWRSLLHWIGGMGFIVFSIAILPLLGVGGMQLFRAESSTPADDKLTPTVRETALYLWAVYALFTFVNFLLLVFHPDMDWFEALNHAFSTLATGGFSTKDASIGHFNSLYIDVVTIVFMFLAGISFAMHYRLLTGKTGAFFYNRETRFYTLVCVSFVTLIFFGLWLSGDYSAGDALRHGSFQALSIITTTGFGTDNYDAWPAVAVMLMFILFFTGGCAGSTGGGIKMIRIMIILRTTQNELKKALHPNAVIPVRIGNRTIEPSIVKTILSFFTLYMLTFFLGALALSAMDIDIVSALGASIACLGSIGPAFGDFGPAENYASLPDTGKWILSLLMMIGRLEVFTVLVLLSPAFWKS